jgi:hypothetical protein
MDVESDGKPAEGMTRNYSSDSDSSDGAVSAVSRDGARLDSAGKSISGRKSSSNKLQTGAYVLKGQGRLCFGQLRRARCLALQKGASKPSAAGGAAAALETGATALSASAQPSGAPKRARLDGSAKLDLEVLLGTLDASSISVPPPRRTIGAPVVPPPIPPMLSAGPTGAGKTSALEGQLLAQRGG